MANSELLYQIGLTLIPGIGDVNGKKLLAYCGSPEAVFKEKRSALMKIPGIGEATVKSIFSHDVYSRAEKEIKFIEKFKIQPLFYTHPDYPKRLLNCEDGPLMLYFKGSYNLNCKRVVAFVGTRRATNYGKRICEELIGDLITKDVLIVSGLAYGIDSCAHRKSVADTIPTVAVLAHGLDRIYPSQNKTLAEKMVRHGGLVTEFLSGSNPDRENFPKRNRIVAGMSDAIVVVESGRKGGALITADIGNSYNRDVFAVPGKIGDEMSKGTNQLIKTNRAALIESAADIAYVMGWDEKPVAKKSQVELFVNLNKDEIKVLDVIRSEKEMAIDKIILKSGLPSSKVAAALLNLEFENLVQSLPGKLYKA